MHGRTLDERYLGGRPQLLNDSMHDGGEQHGLVVEAVVKRTLRNAGARGNRFDGCRPVAFREKELGCDLQYSLAEKQRIRPRRSSATSCLGRRGPSILTDGDMQI